MKAKSIKGASTGEIKTALKEAMAGGCQPTLANAFLSVKQNSDAVSKLLDEKGIQLFGATTASEFTDGVIKKGSIVILLPDIKPDYFRIQFLETSQETVFAEANRIWLSSL